MNVTGNVKAFFKAGREFACFHIIAVTYKKNIYYKTLIQ
jgi:hypothetical protein